jgi:myo-inositol-1(or 4)-monophosphatase
MTSTTQATIEQLVQEAGRVALASYGADRGRRKSDGTWVTRADRSIERAIRRGLTDLLDVRIFGEEDNWSGGEASPYLAIIDPIDGTDAYRNHMPFWGLSVAILEYRAGMWTPWLGILHMPAGGDTFVGRAGSAAWNDRRLRIPKPPSPLTAELCLGVSSDAHGWNLAAYPGKIRAFGASGLHLALVATGMLQATLLTRFYWHDVAAAAIVLWGAGGALYRTDGSLLTPGALVEQVTSRPLERPKAILASHPDSISDLVACKFRPRK